MSNSNIRQHKEIAMGKPVTGLKNGGSPARFGMKDGGAKKTPPKKTGKSGKRGC